MIEVCLEAEIWKLHSQYNGWETISSWIVFSLLAMLFDERRSWCTGWWEVGWKCIEDPLKKNLIKKIVDIAHVNDRPCFQSCFGGSITPK